MTKPRAAILLLALVVAFGTGPRASAGEEPPLPAFGMAQPAEPAPALPPMGEEPPPSGAPPLPLMDEEAPGPEARPETLSDVLDGMLQALPFPLHGFLEVRVGPRYVDDHHHGGDFTLGETRLQLESDPHVGPAQLDLKIDFLYDAATREALAQVREANVAFSPFAFMDVKVGRQVLTWGTGDLLFINDLFPKDYVSFFIGRDVEYLKAPSDALKVSVFGLPGELNLDVVYVPQFDSDIFFTGKRLTYFNPIIGARAGSRARIRTIMPDDWFRDDEVHLRLFRNVGSYELAAYGYRGFWKAPQGYSMIAGKFTFPRLDAYGASARGPVAGGIGNVELGYYDSRDDPTGSNPFVPNGQVRALVGYSRDLPQLTQDFTIGVQYYLEHTLDYGAMKKTWPKGSPLPDRDHHVLTLRLTKLMMNQDLTLSMFTFWSPSDRDAYLRPHATYKITDRWVVDAGANIFFGTRAHTPTPSSASSTRTATSTPGCATASEGAVRIRPRTRTRVSGQQGGMILATSP